MDPRAISVHCDGAMNLDSRQTGGNGFVIEFPEAIEAETITRSLRNDGQGIHRLEMISLIEAMEEILRFEKKRPSILRKASGIQIYTDRLRVTDEQLTNPYRLREYRRNGWITHDGKEIKDRDLLDKIDKLRFKLSGYTAGPVTIKFKGEKKNRIADKLSKAGKKSETRSKKIFLKKNRQVSPRSFDKPEIKYHLLKGKKFLRLRVYAWELLKENYEVCTEPVSGEFKGYIVRAQVTSSQKENLHRQHVYKVSIASIGQYHITIGSIKEINRESVTNH